MDCVRPAKITPGVTPWAASGNAKSPAADCNVSYSTQVVSFQGNDSPDFRQIGHHLPDPAQVAQALLADVSGHQHVDCWHLTSLAQQRLQHNHSSDCDTVVANARANQPTVDLHNLERSLLRKYGVDMRGNEERTCASRRRNPSLHASDDVTDLVPLCEESFPRKQLLYEQGFRPFVASGRRHSRDTRGQLDHAGAHRNRRGLHRVNALC
jgi:hypothetical protein